MSEDWEFMEVDIIKEKCVCIHKSTCMEIAKALEEKDYRKADKHMSRLIIEEDLDRNWPTEWNKQH